MERVKTFNQFLLESNNNEMINEAIIAGTIDKIVDWWEDRKEKNVVKGQHAKKAKEFNYSDFIKFIKSILPSYSNLKEKKQKLDFFKKIDKYLEPIVGIIGVFTILLVFSDDFKNLFVNSIGVGGVLTIWGINWLANLVSKICKNSITDSNDVKLTIERQWNSNKVQINFDFYYAINVKNTYRILYNSVVRLLQQYEDEPWSGIEWGSESPIKEDDGTVKLYSGRQHIIKMDFYPEELIDLLYETTLDIFYDRKQYAEEHDIEHKAIMDDNLRTRSVEFKNMMDNKGLGAIEFQERKDTVNTQMYIQNMSNKQIIDLSKKIDNLKLEYHKPNIKPLPTKEEIEKQAEESKRRWEAERERTE